MYLIIFEDGGIKKAYSICVDDKRAADDGLLDIIDLKTTKQWVDGAWQDIADI